MEIHSNQSGEEKDENIAQLLSLESPENKIEIVIHVNMLKEGWDVTNLYTIIPLRTAASTTLREQTIGRGLRLPYGKRTGYDKADKLTIIFINLTLRLKKIFAVILENDKAVLKWLRPAQNQFHIYWKHNSKSYHPDFVVETADMIYIIETKKRVILNLLMFRRKHRQH